jgi:hypothetical protein
MNISKRDTKLLLILFGIVILILSYFTFYLRYSEENEELRYDIDDAYFKYEQFLALERQLASEGDTLEGFENFILEAQAEYPSDIRAEDLIMYAVELRDNVGIGAGGITFIQPIEIMTVRGLTKNENDIHTFKTRNAFRTGFNMSVNLTYQQLKDLVNYVYNESPQTSIHSISLSYNSATGSLFGNVVINKNFLSPHDIDYVAAHIPAMDMGLPNPFGVIGTVQAPSPPPPPPPPEPEPDGQLTIDDEIEPGEDYEETDENQETI